MRSIDIEAALIPWLAQRVSVPIFAEVPNGKDQYGENGRPNEFITVERTGGARDTEVIDRPSVAIQCWSTSRSKASKLAYEVDEVMQSFLEVQGVTKVQRNGLYNFPDLLGGKLANRYQLIFDFVTTK